MISNIYAPDSPLTLTLGEIIFPISYKIQFSINETINSFHVSDNVPDFYIGTTQYMIYDSEIYLSEDGHIIRFEHRDGMYDNSNNNTPPTLDSNPSP